MAEIPLTLGKVAIVDEGDFPYLSRFKWWAVARDGRFYACRSYSDDNGVDRVEYMHRAILKPSGKDVVDHINGDGLDNRRSNIRTCSTAQNTAHAHGLRSTNSSGFVGVFWNAGKRRWQASIGHEGRNIYIGRFSNPAEAARARDRKAIEFHGEFAYLNFPAE